MVSWLTVTAIRPYLDFVFYPHSPPYAIFVPLFQTVFDLDAEYV